MLETTGNLWSYNDQGWIVITTNGTVKKNGECVMGRGVARDAAQRYPEMPKLLGRWITAQGNRVGCFPTYNLITMPVKHNWYEKADLALIRHSARQLADVFEPGSDDRIYLPRPGCGNGHLDWADVKPLIEPILDERFIVVTLLHN